MPRGVKQLLYGIFYLAVLVALGFGAYKTFWSSVPSCFDHVRNEGEQGIDCGGPCAQICLAALSPVGLLQPPSIFPNGPGHATIVTQIANVNAGVGATDFKYVFSLRDASGTVVGSIPGDSFAYPGQAKYLVAVNETVATSVVSGDFSIVGDVSWVASSTMGSAPMLSFQNVATASVASGTLAASGILVNQDPVAVSNVLIVAFFKNSSGGTVGVSRTQIDSVTGGGTANFSVLCPSNASIDPTKTEVYAYALRM